MIRSPALFLSLLVLVLALCAQPKPSSAVPTATFKVSTFDELNRGEPKGTFISSEGEVVLGRPTQRLQGSALMMWSTVRGSDGTVYFGSGDQGLVYAAQGDKLRKVADLKSVLVTSLAVGPRGKLLAGTVPGAKILEVDPKTGQWKELAKLPTKHVWALLYDESHRRIYAASGAPGKIFSLPDNGGTPQIYYDPGEKHLLCLARGPGGTLLTGSADSGILYEVTKQGQGFALHDFDATELRDIAVHPDGTIYVAANKFARKTSGLPRFDHAKDGENGTTASSASKKTERSDKDAVRAEELRPGAKSGKGALYRVTHSGSADQLLSLDKGYFTDIELDPTGVLWAGDGTKGKVYLVEPDRTVLTAFDMTERQVLALSVAGRDRYLGTGDGGAVYRLGTGSPAQPTYLSDIFDAKFPSRWGRLRYQSSTKLKVESRAGNTAKPDKTWSDWRQAQLEPASTAQLRSQPARYLQLRFTLPGQQSAALRSFTVFYRPENQRARVSEINIDGEDKPSSDKSSSDKSKAKSSKTKITWKVDNPDEDTLAYRLYVREEMGLSWRLISGPEPLEKAEFEWDTEPVADGYYRIKVVASDEKSNPAELSLSDTRLSARLLVDNREPEIVGPAVRFPWVSGLARDSYSPIKRIEYSLDGESWNLVDTTDGIYDTPAESFRFKLPADLRRGAHVLAIRALDAADNMGVFQLNFVR